MSFYIIIYLDYFLKFCFEDLYLIVDYTLLL